MLKRLRFKCGIKLKYSKKHTEANPGFIIIIIKFCLISHIIFKMRVFVRGTYFRNVSFYFAHPRLSCSPQVI